MAHSMKATSAKVAFYVDFVIMFLGDEHDGGLSGDEEPALFLHSKNLKGNHMDKTDLVAKSLPPQDNQALNSQQINRTFPCHWEEGRLMRIWFGPTFTFFMEWAQLQRHDDHIKLIKDACRIFESTIMQLFANFKWRFINRIQ
uniref:Uncharacterized protein n=1 Tax=Oryza meridionalis TaxID=40149 RepID=A0A0E0FBL2_9ORYZ